MELALAAAPIPLVYLPLLQNRFKYIIRYRDIPVAGRCLQPHFLLCKGLGCKILLLWVGPLRQLPFYSQRPVNIIHIRVFHSIDLPAPEPHQYVEQHLHMNRSVPAGLQQDQYLIHIQSFLCVDVSGMVWLLRYLFIHPFFNSISPF